MVLRKVRLATSDPHPRSSLPRITSSCLILILQQWYHPPTISLTAGNFIFKTCGKIDNITEYNNLSWSSSMKDHLGACGQFSIVLGEYTSPPRACRIQRVGEKDAWARGTVKGACLRELQNYIKRTGTHAEVWKVLESYVNGATSIKR